MNYYEQRSRSNRASFLRKVGAGGALLSVPGLLAACGGSGIGGDADTAAPAATGATEATGAAATTAVPQVLKDKLVFSNWPLYIDVDDKTGRRPSLDDFTKATGVKVDYIEEINSNEEFYGKVQAQLSQGKGIGRDLMVLTNFMAARMVQKKFLEPLDKGAIPNLKNLDPTIASPTWDPDRTYSIPWQSGFTGLAYDPEKTGKDLTSVDDLLDPKLKGKFTLLNALGDTLGLIMMQDGVDPTTVSKAQFDAAMKKLDLLAKNARGFTGNEYAPMLAKGDIWAAFGWSGDVAQIQLDHPGLKFAIPEAGGMVWTDNLLIPLGGDVFTASTYINYIYDPAVAAKIEAYVNYISPVVGSDAEMKKIDPDVASNPLIFPPADWLARVKAFDVEAENNEEYKQIFAEVTGV